MNSLLNNKGSKRFVVKRAAFFAPRNGQTDKRTLQKTKKKCFHANRVCGYCDLCGGYYRPSVKDLNTAAENQLCPTGAITRKFVEEPYFEYTIDESLCTGCGKCVKGCTSFGNGSLFLQIQQDLCQNCNECQIARTCPSDAIKRVSYNEAYQLKDHA